jgi:hypothetical protein
MKSNWSEININSYNEILDLQQSPGPYIDRILETFSIIYETDSFDDYTPSELISAWKSHTFLTKEPEMVYNTVHDKEMKPLTSLCMAEWIELTDLVDRNDLLGIVSLLYRGTNLNEWGHTIYEPYSYSLNERKELFNRVPISDVYYVYKSAVEYRNNVLENFKSIFTSFESDITEDEKEGLNEQEIREIENEIRKENLKKHYSWQKLLDNISGSDWSKIPNILELNHLLVFNMMVTKSVYGD